ncbi:hypothetical protein [Salinimonas lutimaris]|uniref:hypothetical protein n=1 Tax=Salinimonas lutimaris TaxID=914153 RepID=UPI0010BF6A3E|nr:hypothetical protein [Salinimonas lutimaris]
MPIEFKKKVAVLDGNCEIDLAEELDLWLQESAGRQVNLKNLTNAHTAIYQVLIRRRPGVSVWPQDAAFHWLSKAMANDAQGTAEYGT